MLLQQNEPIHLHYVTHQPHLTHSSIPFNYPDRAEAGTQEPPRREPRLPDRQVHSLAGQQQSPCVPAQQPPLRARLVALAPAPRAAPERPGRSQRPRQRAALSEERQARRSPWPAAAAEPGLAAAGRADGPGRGWPVRGHGSAGRQRRQALVAAVRHAQLPPEYRQVSREFMYKSIMFFFCIFHGA